MVTLINSPSSAINYFTFDKSINIIKFLLPTRKSVWYSWHMQSERKRNSTSHSGQSSQGGPSSYALKFSDFSLIFFNFFQPFLIRIQKLIIHVLPWYKLALLQLLELVDRAHEDFWPVWQPHRIKLNSLHFNINFNEWNGGWMDGWINILPTYKY